MSARPVSRQASFLGWLVGVSFTCIIIIAVIIFIIIIVIIVPFLKVLSHPSDSSVLQSTSETPAVAVNRLRSSSQPSPPLWTQLIIIIIQVGVLFSLSSYFKVFTVIVALPGVDRLSLSVLISSAVLSTVRGKALP